MKKAIIVARSDPGSPGVTWGGAFAAGLKRHGWEAFLSREPGKCDLLVLWGTRRPDRIGNQKADGGEVCILERGYLGDRFQWTSVSFGGGLNNRGIFRGPFEDPSRWRKHFHGLLKPWQSERDGYALILGQVPGDMSVSGVDLGSFYTKCGHELALLGYEVRFRPHPKAGPMQVRGIRSTEGGSLAEDLAGAALTVSYNSNSSAEAVLAGVPSITIDKGAMAWDVTDHEFIKPRNHLREPWAHALAWKQWTMDEISSGACWAAVGAE